MRVLILGGTSEARALAALLDSDPAHKVTSSLAGRVRNPALPAGAHVIGGFGGVSGLVAFLGEHQIDAVVDATHPFARTISANAVAACEQVAVPLLGLRRPGWTEHPGDRWERVPSVVAAAAVVGNRVASGDCVFVTSGRQELAPFAADRERHYLIRTVDSPETALPLNHTLLLDRGPYTRDGERTLMREHRVRLLVTKNSGGPMTYAKIEAARELGINVVVIDRPPPPDGGGQVVATPPEALAWCQSQANGSQRAGPHLEGPRT